ncbi:MAG: hypothetical protein HY587_07140 [Candidatus Omnitrophica bacterium]|nr:hypothetical protein [Candidatus Omnitrophota bacterium]
MANSVPRERGRFSPWDSEKLKAEKSAAPKSRKTVLFFSYFWDGLKAVASRPLVPAHEIADQKWAAVLCYEVRL